MRKTVHADPVRSRIMRSIKGTDTGIEMVMRRALHALGYRFTVHGKNLPGRPDLVFAARRKVVFVHGCFWHSHGCRDGKAPRTRQEFWLPKLAANRERDARSEVSLREAGWDVLVLWGCHIEWRGQDALAQTLDFLGPARHRRQGE